MYKHEKCFTCNVILKRPSQRCPNPTVIKQDFTRCGDVDVYNTGDDKICTNCYNAHLGILHEMELLSTNEELKTLVENPSQCIPAGRRYSDYVSQALQEVMVKVNILLRNVALLFPEVYRLFINEALQRALVG